MSDVDATAVNGLIAKSAEIMEEAQDKVLHPETHTATVNICGHKVDLRPLPISYSKKWGKLLRDVLKLSAGSEGSDDRRKWMEESDEMICDAMCNCVAMLKDLYRIPNLTVELIQEHMRTEEVKHVVATQARLNDENDFLLRPVFLTLTILSGAPPATFPPIPGNADSSLLEAQQSSTQDS